MKSHAEVREIPCPYCDEVFPQRYILYDHLINDHEESSNLTCPICNKVRCKSWPLAPRKGFWFQPSTFPAGD